MAEYTPRTKAEVSNTWAMHRGRVEQTNDLRPFHAEFDRWLAAHDAALLAEHPAPVVAQETDDAALSAEPCTAETWSWDHFRSTQVDAYWIRCTRLGHLHDDHEDAHTGLTWRVEADETGGACPFTFPAIIGGCRCHLPAGHGPAHRCAGHDDTEEGTDHG